MHVLYSHDVFAANTAYPMWALRSLHRLGNIVIPAVIPDTLQLRDQLSCAGVIMRRGAEVVAEGGSTDQQLFCQLTSPGKWLP